MRKMLNRCLRATACVTLSLLATTALAEPVPEEANTRLTSAALWWMFYKSTIAWHLLLRLSVVVIIES